MKITAVLAYVAGILLLGCGAVSAAPMSGHDGHSGHEQKAGVSAGSSHADVAQHKACPHCGMDRGKFAHSRMLISYADGSVVGVCSLHCAVTEIKASKAKALKTVQVGDVQTQKLLDAEQATWTIGGTKRGVMTRVAKWAFAKKDDAAAFIKKNGGQLATYKEALAIAEKE
ncbi:MAG: hypothetical protein A2076_05475 [Geobacteraceae bacterium GWC2_53_11]|nr:MAG: hypothetical protein A2076_05475 [Geobacteraceae bacterium GWC2_53_11]